MVGDAYDYLMLSDVHLGSDIVPHLRPWATSTWLMRDADVDERLVSFLDYHRRERSPGRPWKLVIAGDFLDLVGVSIGPYDALVRTPPTPEERRNGMGSAADHVVHKIRRIADRHTRVFRSLNAFVAEGHSIVLVRGNHDVELHWRAAQRAFVQAIVQHEPDPARRTALASQIEVCPWFFAVEGVLYVEHGHEFDRMCGYGDPLLPTCLRDPKRIRSTPFSVLLRNVARPTKGLSTASYGYVGMGAYLTLLANLGLVGSAQIAVRYARACTRLVSECFARASSDAREAVRRLRARARLKRFALRVAVDESLLVALSALYERPAFASLSFVLRSLYLDRMLAGALALTSGALTLWLQTHAFSVSAAISAFATVVLMLFTLLGRGSNTAPTARMHEGATKIAALFRARWVVMGHTHQPVFASIGNDATYVNLGSWGADELPDEQTEAHPCSSTFLVLREREGAYHGELLRWNAEEARGEPAWGEPVQAVRAADEEDVFFAAAE